MEWPLHFLEVFKSVFGALWHATRSDEIRRRVFTPQNATTSRISENLTKKVTPSKNKFYISLFVFISQLRNQIPRIGECDN